MHEQQNKHATLERNQAVVISEYPIPEKNAFIQCICCNSQRDFSNSFIMFA